MNVKTILIGVLLAGSMQQSWAMNGAGELETEKLKMQVRELKQEVADLKRELKSVKQNQELKNEVAALTRAVNRLQTQVGNTQCHRKDEDME